MTALRSRLVDALGRAWYLGVLVPSLLLFLGAWAVWWGILLLHPEPQPVTPNAPGDDDPNDATTKGPPHVH